MTAWTQITTSNIQGNNSKFYRETTFRALEASPSSGTVTFTFGATQTAFTWAIIECDHMDTTGTNGSGAIVQSTQSAGNGFSAVDCNLTSALGATGHALFGWLVTENASGPQITPDTGYTELAAEFINSQEIDSEAEYKTPVSTGSGTLAHNVHWDMTGTHVFVDGCFEIKASGG